MTGSPVDALREQIAARTVVAVIGSGVSVAASGLATTASWPGLLRSGIDRALNFNSALPPGWKDHVLKELAFAEENNYLPDLLAVAEKITIALGGKEGGEFKSWLRDDIGALKISDIAGGQDLIEAVSSLGLPIVTTNYDSLIERALTRSTSTWLDSSDAQLVIQGTTSNILHLHGSWEQPTSIVFGSASYAELLANPAAKAIEQILAGGRSLLFIGCGAGLSDPNFAAIRDWLAKTFPGSETRHYRLCLNKELPELIKEHEADRITPIPYGDSYDILSSFVRGLVPPDGGAMQPRWKVGISVQQRAIEAIEARVRTETVMAEYFADVETRALVDILIPPVLLPVTQEQFARAANLDQNIRPQRCEPQRDVRDYSHVLVAADETAGLTSALEWMVAEVSNFNTSLTPVFVDFRRLGAGPRPLEKQIRKELKLAGVNLRASDPLPKMALALDNLAIRPDKIFSRALSELTGDSYDFVVLGCRQGSEASILERLEELAIEPVVRYLGRLNNKDATKMAALVEPTRADKLASKAIQIANNEHLPRTPLTIGLLVCMLLHGEALLSAASGTALLDAWVNLLLGRGDPHDDARFSLDSLEKANILAFLAERFVQAKTGSLSEPAAVACLDEYFAAVGWSEDPIEVLGNFKSRYLLAVRNGQVRFAQSSYLHLFAAKRAIESAEFRSMLFEDPLYFSPILRHYAALTRNGVDILVRVERLLTPTGAIEAPPTGSSFSDVDGDSDSSSLTSIEDLMRQLSLSGGEGHAVKVEASGNAARVPSEWIDSWLDRTDDTDREPFPLEAIEDAEPAVRIMAALTLVSNVLRDSELVKDLKLKERVLHRTLIIWGQFVDLLDADEDVQSLWRTLADNFSNMLEIPEPRRAHFTEDFCDMASVIVAFGGIMATLSSRKLLRSLEACFEDEDFVNNTGGSVMGALMGFDLHGAGWSRYFIEVQRRHGRVKAVWAVLRRVAEIAYYEEVLEPNDLDRLLDFLVREYGQRVAPRGGADRKRHEDQIIQKLRQNRSLYKSSQGALGGRRKTAEFGATVDKNITS